jgi:hypothetical protein
MVKPAMMQFGDAVYDFMTCFLYILFIFHNSMNIRITQMIPLNPSGASQDLIPASTPLPSGQLDI